jgi:hypothetical protein
MNMLPVLKKPFDTNAIIKIVQSLKLGHGPARRHHPRASPNGRKLGRP